MTKLKAPGLTSRRRKDGSYAHYWMARVVSRRAEKFPDQIIRLHGADEDIVHQAAMHTRELREWLASFEVDVTKRPTVKSLIRNYQHVEESGYHEVKHNTRVMYDDCLKVLEKEVGDAFLDELTGLDFKRWFTKFKAAAPWDAKQLKRISDGEVLPSNPERPRRAYGAMQLLRIIIGFGVVCNIPECVRLVSIIKEMEFKNPKPRTAAMTFAYAEAVCEKAIEKGYLSIALAQALQFELTLRQIDVIGRWEPAGDDMGGIVDRGTRWRDGLLWSHLDSKGVLIKTTSKVDDVIAQHDTMGYPFLRKFINMVPQDKRMGPVIVCETTGLPYRYRHFSDVWRSIANEVGIPSNVWNRDSRAGGVTEGSDAGADLEQLRHHANHKNAQTTARYNRSTIKKTREVAKLRVAARTAENEV